MRRLYGRTRSEMIGKVFLPVLILALALVAGAATNARAADWNVTIGAASANGSWSGGNPDVWTPNASGSTVAASEIVTRLSATVAAGSGPSPSRPREP
jgi:hypothetical protein